MRWLTWHDRSGVRPKRGAAKAPRHRRTHGGKLRRQRTRVDRRLVARGAMGLAGLFMVAAVIGLIGSGWIGRQIEALGHGVDRMTVAFGLAVDEVLVEGRLRTDPGDLLGAVDVARGDPILGFDPQEAKSRIESLIWVKQVTIERRLPSVIYLRIEERRPTALWQVEGQIAVIDEHGQVIMGARPEDFAGLTLVVGPDAPAHAAALLQLLDSEPDLSQRVVAAVRVGGRRWNLRFDGGIDVRLPESGAAEAWTQFARIERQHGVLNRDVDSIDLRLPDRLVVRTAPEQEQPTETADGKNT